MQVFRGLVWCQWVFHIRVPVDQCLDIMTDFLYMKFIGEDKDHIQALLLSQQNEILQQMVR